MANTAFNLLEKLDDRESKLLANYAIGGSMIEIDPANQGTQTSKLIKLYHD